VASTLERRWNDALLQLEDLKKQAAEFQRQEARVATPEQRRKSWRWPKTSGGCGMPPPRRARPQADVALLLKDITVEKPSLPSSSCFTPLHLNPA